MLSFAAELRAIHPIKKGEQITFSYAGAQETRAERQNHLQKMYKFKCTCPLCLDDSPERDVRRIRMMRGRLTNSCDNESGLEVWAQDSTMSDDMIVAECLAMIKVLDEERLYEKEAWSVWYQRIVKAYCALEDKRNAQKWAEKAAKLARAFVGHDAGWDAVVKDPKNTNWWGRRTKTWGVGVEKKEPARDIHFKKDRWDGIRPLKIYTPVSSPVS